MKEAEEICPKSKEEWRKWLSENHKDKAAVWLVFYKKDSPNFNLSWSDSVDEAICFGWIDSTKRTIDKERYKQYFSKRKPKSIWSKINRDKVAELTEKGLMSEAGLETIRVAKENGSWTILDEIENMETPSDLLKELDQYEQALANYENFSKSAKKSILYWLISAKRPETRQKRIKEVAENAELNQMPKPFR